MFGPNSLDWLRLSGLKCLANQSKAIDLIDKIEYELQKGIHLKLL